MSTNTCKKNRQFGSGSSRVLPLSQQMRLEKILMIKEVVMIRKGEEIDQPRWLVQT